MYNAKKSVFFLSGMFAGGWIWNRVSDYLLGAVDFKAISEPLCYLDDNLSGLCRAIIPELESAQGKVSLVGNSLGGLLGLKLAGEIPEKIESVVVSGSPGFGSAAINLRLRKSNPSAMKQNLIDVICYDRKQAENSDFDRVVTSFTEKFRPIIRLASEANKISAETLLSSVQCPVYAIWGKNDSMTPIEKTAPILKRNGIKTHVIDECGHSPMYEKPREFAAFLTMDLHL